MLEPLGRRHLFDALRPPSGYDVDVAIGTTFSMDLLALLTVPLAFALFDWEDDEGRVNSDPMALLEAARRYAGRTHIFCQAAQIHLPSHRSKLLYHLENIVHEVSPPNDRGVFHPKVWILRFVPSARGDPILYRVLCLSRNLTFDRSWDTLLVIEGELTNRERAITANHPLGDFVQALPKMMLHSVSNELRKTVGRIHKELRRVRFTVPEGFDEVRFHALGLAEEGEWWFDSSCDQVLAMAPFLDWGFVKRLTASSPGACMLISRLDQLQVMKPSLLAECQKVYYLDPGAEEPVPEEDDETEPHGAANADVGALNENLSGLHAKLYIADAGWNASVWTGSANGTTAAFSRNVEFLVELTGKRSVCGVDAFLKRAQGQTRFADMLREFTPGDAPPAMDEDARKAEQLADQIRFSLARLGLVANVSSSSDGFFRVEIGSVTKPTKSRRREGVSVRCWPLTLDEREGLETQNLLDGGKLLFSKLSFEALTTFYAFHVRTTVGKRTHDARFVLNLPTEGMPVDRMERMLRSILQNKSLVLRMLLLLLADASSDLLARLFESSSAFSSEGSSGTSSALGELALLEPLLKALDHNPRRLERIARLIDDLKKTGDVELLPQGFLDVWDPIWLVAQELIHEESQR